MIKITWEDITEYFNNEFDEDCRKVEEFDMDGVNIQIFHEESGLVACGTHNNLTTLIDDGDVKALAEEWIKSIFRGGVK